jgi:hypothetical protein
MWSALLVCALSCCGPSADANTPEPAENLIEELKQGLQTGSLIFSQGDCLAVKVFSKSSYTHVAGVVAKDGEFVVYDSMNGIGVRKTPLVEYLRQQTPSLIHVVHPRIPFEEEQAVAYEQHLESQMGRKYSVKHHLTGNRCEGVHCSEYVTDALMAAELISAKQPSRVSPGSLLEGVMTANAYQDGTRIELKTADLSLPPELPWYHRAWHCTTSCCSKSTSQLRRWILCR